MSERHVAVAELEKGLIEAGPSPRNNGILEMIVCRPAEDQRLVLEQATLDPVEGLTGDNWRARGSRHTEDGRANPDTQIAIMNSRIIQLLAGDCSRWPLAGDQLFVDLDLSPENLPPGQRLTIGEAQLEITSIPHTGCGKFSARYGSDALRFVNEAEGRAARRRGVYVRVVKPGVISVGDTVTKQEVDGILPETD